MHRKDFIKASKPLFGNLEGFCKIYEEL